ncbi:MAG: hypothetical protein NTY70_11500 [Burkholderiales bacterium]|nr:hypothetical protein [Burkholderiales bacterium]
MKIQIKEVRQGQWAIYIVSSLAVAAGRTTYASFDEAEKVARTQHPDKEIEVIR